MKCWLMILFLMVMNICFGQGSTSSPPIEQQLENIAEHNDDKEIEDDSYSQQMQSFLKDPVNLNVADESDLRQLKLLSAIQIQNLFEFRKKFGDLLNKYEAQAIPGWDVILLRKISPFITVSSSATVIDDVKTRFRKAKGSIIFRISKTLERSKGYISDSSHDHYSGSPYRIFARYKYAYKGLLQLGITMEKDPGEKLFSGNQKMGFDFYSMHFMLRDIGMIKTLVLGDYNVNMGQGLIQWQGLGFKKGGEVINIKRQDDVIRQYNSAGEINFFRGAGITIKKKKINASLFFTYKKIDANFDDDTLYGFHVTSLQQSGYHRTNAENADRHVLTETGFGGNISYNKRRFHFGINAVNFHFSAPVQRSALPYNKFSFTRDHIADYSADYSYTLFNAHLFGELAVDNSMNKAFITGLMMSVDKRVDISVLYRKISPQYHSLYSDAFTESSSPNNESGFYAGISIKPFDKIRVDGYFDLYNFPWIRYRTDAPTNGNDYMISLDYKPDKNIEIVSRYRSERKAINNNTDGSVLNPVMMIPHQSWRNQFNYKINEVFTFRSRIEMLWYDHGGATEENGFLVNTDLFYKPFRKKITANARLEYFETDGYNSRLYAFENDVLHSTSIPVIYGRGYRYYINFNYDLSKKISVWLRLAQTIYPDKSSIGSGLDEIPGNHKTDVRFQVYYGL